jgi:magnesium transporter
VIVDCAIYKEGERRVGDASLEQAYRASRDGEAFVWIGLHEPSAEEFDSIKREFDLHELAVEDAINAHQRPKVEVYGNTVFVVLKTARYVDPEEVVELGEILIFIGEGFIITVRHGEASSLHDVRLELEKEHERLRCGPGSVLHAILDRVVDDYQPAVDGLAQDIEQVEAEVFSPSRGNPAERIYKLKREVLEFSHSVAPLIDPVDKLSAGQFGVIHPEIQTYMRDVSDHLMRVNDQIDGYRDVLTAIAGIYGMNFQHMPELGWRFGYPGAIALMAVICFVLYRYFRKAGWL